MKEAAKIKVKVEPPFRVLYNLPPKVELVLIIGGRGGMKTYEVSKFGAFEATVRERRVAVLRDEKETIRESILNEIFMRYDTANTFGHFNGTFEKIGNGLRNKQTGAMQIFTKGFRASSNDKRTNLKGVSDTDTAIVEEAEDIRSFEKFNTFRDSIRTKGRLIVVMLNTPDIQHWIIRRYFTLLPITIEDIPEPIRTTWRKRFIDKELEDMLGGYWKLVPKELENVLCIQTSYLDNPHLPEGVIRDYTSYGDPESVTYDLHYYLTAILGFASSGRKGQIYKKVKRISLQEYLNLPIKEITGLDWGTASPAGIAGVKIEGNNIYTREKAYKPSDVLTIAKRFCEWQYGSEDLIIADSAEPRSIAKLQGGWDSDELNDDDLQKYPALSSGFYVLSAIKGPGSIEAGVSLLNSMNFYAVDESDNLWNEIYNYIYAVNKEGEFTNTPIDDFNHLLDPIRYVAQARGRFF